MFFLCSTPASAFKPRPINNLPVLWKEHDTHYGITINTLKYIKYTLSSGNSYIVFKPLALSKIAEANAGVDSGGYLVDLYFDGFSEEQGLYFEKLIDTKEEVENGNFLDPVAHCDEEKIQRCSNRIKKNREDIVIVIPNSFYL